MHSDHLMKNTPVRRKARGFVRWLFGGALMGMLAVGAMAFPPAPYYTIYGDVRDEMGALIPAGGATIIFSYQSKEVSRYPLLAVPGTNYSYEIRMRIDMKGVGTAVYNAAVVTPGTDYTLAVDVGGVRYLPLELAAASPKVGAPADRRRLDLTLGVDSDKDGLPDAWERMLLERMGLPTNDLSKITPDGVLADGTGLTNLQKYLAGTYSGDTRYAFYLKISAATDTDVTVDFFTIAGKVYSIERSADLANWAPVDFTVGTGAASSTYAASGSTVSAKIPWVSTDVQAYYRLKVR